MRKLKLIWYLLIIIPILLIILGYIFPSAFFSNQEKLQAFIEPYGAWGPLIFILIQILQVVLTPINHYVIGIVGGFLFGTWHGFFYNWIGRVIGTLIAFILGRKFGRKIIQHVVKPKTLKKYDKLFDKGTIVIFLMYSLPLFPIDELSYLAGFSSMKAKIFVPIIAIGHIGGSLTLAYIGSGISTKDPLFYFFLFGLIVLGIIFIVLYKKLHKD